MKSVEGRDVRRDILLACQSLFERNELDTRAFEYVRDERDIMFRNAILRSAS